jgi:hypothetical protein
MSKKTGGQESQGKPFRTSSAIGAAGLTAVCLGGSLAHHADDLSRVTLVPQVMEYADRGPSHDDTPAAFADPKLERGDYPLASGALHPGAGTG